MKGLKKGITAGVLTAAICMTSVFTACAETEEEEKKGIWASVGSWFVDRGTDIGDAATMAADVTGQWFINRGEDICEAADVVGTWTYDRVNDVVVLVTDASEAIVYAASNFDPSVLTTKEYYWDSGEKLILGDYSDKDPTALSMGLNLAASVVNLDLGMDIRDLVYDIQNFGSEDVKLSGIALDAVAVLPIIGVVKYVKYADAVVDGVKIAGKVTDTASDLAKDVDKAIDIADTVHDAAKVTDDVDIAADTAMTGYVVMDAVTDTTKATVIIDDMSDTTKVAADVTGAAKTADVADDMADAGKAIGEIPFEELPEKAQETFLIYEECAWDGEKALEKLAEGTHAGQTWGNKEGLLPSTDVTGNTLSYREYDAYSLGDDPEPPLHPGGRGGCRFVRDNLGNVYFTNDHYKKGSFMLIIKRIEGWEYE